MTVATTLPPLYNISKKRETPRPLDLRASFGANDVTRTHDLLITNQLLYRLSYISKWDFPTQSMISHFLPFVNRNFKKHAVHRGGGFGQNPHAARPFLFPREFTITRSVIYPVQSYQHCAQVCPQNQAETAQLFLDFPLFSTGLPQVIHLVHAFHMLT